MDIDYDTLCTLAGADGHNLSPYCNTGYSNYIRFGIGYRSLHESNRPILSHRLDYIPHPSPTGRYPYWGEIK